MMIHLMFPPYPPPLWQVVDHTSEVDTAPSLINMMIMMISVLNMMIMISMIIMMIIVGKVENLNIEVWIPFNVCMWHCNSL